MNLLIFRGIRYIEYDKELRIDLVTRAEESLKEAIKDTYNRKDEDVFSLVQILGRDAAKVDESKVNPDTLAILSEIRAMRASMNQFNSTSYAGVIPIELVQNIIRFTEGTDLYDYGLPIVSGLSVFINTIGTVRFVGVGSYNGTGVVIGESAGQLFGIRASYVRNLLQLE